MKEFKIYEDLYLFSSSVQGLPLTFNQYLLTGAEPVLFHTGSWNQTAELIPKLKSALLNQELSYVFVSHFESDECGGLGKLLEVYPKVKVICSPVTARQLSGFGINCEVAAKSPLDIVETGDYKLEFISYPSEMHLWEGLLAYDHKRSILFSSDLFIRMGIPENIIISSDLKEEVSKILPQQIPDPNGRETLQKTLLNMNIKNIATGHGPFIKL